MDAANNQKQTGSKPALSSQARRALAEAEKRREKTDKTAGPRHAEVDGRDGPEPTRYGDWEKNGIISDF